MIDIIVWSVECGVWSVKFCVCGLKLLKTKHKVQVIKNEDA